jgi:BlaI family transcriptional regulator, penicillinase repressor
MRKPESLTRRESQVMDVIYELGEASAKEVQQRLPKPPSYSAVRAVLSRLVEQGHLKYRASGPRYVYAPATGKQKARQAALRKLVDTFFDGSPLHTMNALLGISASELTKEELDELAKAIEEAKEKSA